MIKTGKVEEAVRIMHDLKLIVQITKRIISIQVNQKRFFSGTYFLMRIII